MSDERVLPAYTIDAANRPLPEPVAACAAELGAATAAMADDEHLRPGRMFEWLVHNGADADDKRIRELVTEAGPWLDHGMFARQFMASFTTAIGDHSKDNGFAAANGVIEATRGGAAGRVPQVLHRDSIQTVLAATIGQIYAGLAEPGRDHVAAGAVLDHLAVIVEALSYDGRVVHAASPASAILKLAEFLGPGAVAGT